MKFLFDLFPILLFFIAYKFGGIYIATAVSIVASIVQIGYLLIRHKKVDMAMWISLGIVIVLGGATLVSHNDTFIKWKPTALYWLFAITLLASPLLFKKNIIRSMLSEQITLPERVWRKLNLSWAIFFIVMGLVNRYVALTYSTDVWVNFKLFGSTAMMFIFIIGQGIVLNKYLDNKKHD
ncbi:MAG TPA: septation protein A [Burkholderiales bacterium]|nr:septation protein A [Burkholderiales bacterium]